MVLAFLSLLAKFALLNMLQDQLPSREERITNWVQTKADDQDTSRIRQQHLLNQTTLLQKEMVHNADVILMKYTNLDEEKY